MKRERERGREKEAREVYNEIMHCTCKSPSMCPIAVSTASGTGSDVNILRRSTEAVPLIELDSVFHRVS